jgi:hypothetical protein
MAATLTEMQFHDAANIFPIDDEAIGDLAADIKKNGQLLPIEILDGKVLDGRRRWLACKMNGCKPITKDVKVADPIAYVLSLNLHRRHLSETQLGMVAGRAREMYDQQAKERQRGGQGGKLLVANLPQGKSRDAVGAAVGVSGKTVDHATKVLRHGTPELIAAVDADKVAVSTAARMTGLTDEKQNEWLEGAVKHNRTGARKNEVDVPDNGNGEVKQRGVGILRANEAINSLSRIPKNDALRKRGFQLVTDWMKANR